MRRTRLSLLAAAVAAAALAPSTANAAVKPGRMIENFHGVNFVALDGYPAGADVLVEIVRGPAVIGTARVTTSPDGTAEINHVGGGAPPAGDCFIDTTPDILPGDTIRTTLASDPADVDTSEVRDVFREEPVIVEVPVDAADPASPTRQVIRVTGHGRETDGTPLDGVEIRLNRTSGTWQAASARGRRDWRMPAVIAPDGTFSVDFEGASEADLAAVAAAEASAEWAAGDLSELTVFDGVAGALQGCGPLLFTGITAVSHSVVNAAFTGDVVVSGVAQPGVTEITVPGATVTRDGSAWQAAIPAASLTEGENTIVATFSSDGSAPPSASVKVTRDTVAPAAPVSDLAAGIYETAQSIHLTGENAIRYTTDGTPAAATSALYSGPLMVTATRTIRAVAVDAAGNVSAEATFTYEITPPPPPPAPAPVVIEVPVPVPAPAPAPIADRAPTAPISISGLRAPSRVSLAGARRGVTVRFAMPQGSKSLKVVVRRNGRVVSRSTTAARGTTTLKLRLSRAGSYRVELTPLGERPGTTAVARIRVA